MAVAAASTSSNPDGHRCCCCDQRVTRCFQWAMSIKVEFSNKFVEARDTSNPYPSAQSLFEWGRAPGEDNTFNDVFKKDFIEVTAIKACRKMRVMRIDPYPDAIIRRGLHKKEPRETAEPILEEAMIYTTVVGMEMLEGLAITLDMVDRMALEMSKRKAEVDGALVQLCHQLGQQDNRLAIIDEWKEDATGHMWDIGEAQGLM